MDESHLNYPYVIVTLLLLVVQWDGRSPGAYLCYIRRSAFNIR